MLQIDNVNYKYYAQDGETTVLENLTFSVKEGEFVSILGPSGCGKTTILSLISGLLTPNSGTITINDKAVSGISLAVGYMLQHDHLFEWRTIWQNVMLGLQIQKQLTTPKGERKFKNIFKQVKINSEDIDHANFLLERYGLIDFKNFLPRQLSGGMRQRVALIRTLVLKPTILLLDEPFSALDYQNRLKLSDDVFEMIATENKTAILVTHDIAEAISLSDRILILGCRPSSIIEEIDTNMRDYGTPLARRRSPNFNKWFDTIWKFLGSDNEK